MIPAVLIAVVITACARNDSAPQASITVEQRRAAINSAMEHLDADRINEAMAIVSTLVKKDPASPQTQETYATVLLANSLKLDKFGDLAKGIEYRQRALEAYKAACNYSSSPGLLQLSTAQLAQMIGDNATAKTFYTLAHASNPKDGRPSFFLAQLHLLTKNWAQAKHWANESLLRDPNEPFTLLSASLAEAELGNIASALQFAERGCDILPNDPQIRFMQARVIRLSGKPEQALEILSRLPEPLRSSDIANDERQLCLQQTQDEPE